MGLFELTRRTFCRIAGAGGLAVVTGCVEIIDPSVPGGDNGETPIDVDDVAVSGNGVVILRRAGRSRRISNAAKKHNANRLYATVAAAQSDPAHPGDNSKIVPVVVSRARFEELFGGGRVIADLRLL